MALKINRFDLPEGPHGKTVKLEFSGNLANDEIELCQFNFDADTEIQLILNNLTSVNSLGVRSFVNWHKQLSYKNFVIVDAPKCFIDQANMVDSFLPPRIKFKSFFVPYYSEQTEEETNILFEVGINYFKFNNQWKFSFPEVLDAEKNPMELDIQPERYFQFLKNLA